MILHTYRCDLCKRECANPYAGYRITFSGDGALGFSWLDDEKATETIICKHCAKGLRYAMAHLPKPPPPGSGYEDD